MLRSSYVIRYDPALTGGRIAGRYLREVFPRAKVTMDVRAIAFVARRADTENRNVAAVAEALMG